MTHPTTTRPRRATTPTSIFGRNFHRKYYQNACGRSLIVYLPIVNPKPYEPCGTSCFSFLGHSTILSWDAPSFFVIFAEAKKQSQLQGLGTRVEGSGLRIWGWGPGHPQNPAMNVALYYYSMRAIIDLLHETELPPNYPLRSILLTVSGPKHRIIWAQMCSCILLCR